MQLIKIFNPVPTAIVLGIASVVAGGLKGFYDSKHGETDFSTVGYFAAIEGVVGGAFGYCAAHLGSSFMLNSTKPSKATIAVFTGAGAVVGGLKGGLETAVGYVFGYGLGKIV